jgi:hypothetical protein
MVAPFGTVAMSFVGDREVTLALVPLKFTTELELNPTPLIVTDVPTAALVGLRPVIGSPRTDAPS